jgi:hypothetical protein
MNKRGWTAVGVVVIGGALAAGWWFKGREGAVAAGGEARAAVSSTAKKDIPLEFLAAEVVKP